MDLKGKNVLITAGGTREYIDDVRVVTNISTGALGAKIAEGFYEAGCRVHYVHSKQAVMPNCLGSSHETSRLMTHQIVTVNDLKETMEALIKGFKIDIVIHSAAVSDFTFDRSEPIKLSSSSAEDFIEHMRKTIKPTVKIINLIKEWRPEVILVGFKFTVGKTNREKFEIAAKSMVGYKGDYVIVNDKFEMEARKSHIAYLINSTNPDSIVGLEGKNHIAATLIKVLSERV